MLLRLWAARLPSPRTRQQIPPASLWVHPHHAPEPSWGAASPAGPAGLFLPHKHPARATPDTNCCPQLPQGQARLSRELDGGWGTPRMAAAAPGCSVGSHTKAGCCWQPCSPVCTSTPAWWPISSAKAVAAVGNASTGHCQRLLPRLPAAWCLRAPCATLTCRAPAQAQQSLLGASPDSSSGTCQPVQCGHILGGGRTEVR